MNTYIVCPQSHYDLQIQKGPKKMVAINELREQRVKYMQCILPDIYIIAANIVTNITIIPLCPYDALKTKHSITACCVDEWANYMLVLILYNICYSEYDYEDISISPYFSINFLSIIIKLFSQFIQQAFIENIVCIEEHYASIVSIAYIIESEFLTMSFFTSSASSPGISSSPSTRASALWRVLDKTCLCVLAQLVSLLVWHTQACLSFSIHLSSQHMLIEDSLGSSSALGSGVVAVNASQPCPGSTSFFAQSPHPFRCPGGLCCVSPLYFSFL